MPRPAASPAPPRVRRRTHRRLAAVVGALFACLVPALAAAHPLGNFTINHYSGLTVRPDRILVDQVLDLAEIPTFQALRATGGGFGPDGSDAYARDRCTALVASLRLVIDGSDRPLTLTAASASLPPGQGGLSTLRLECAYEASLDVPIATTTTIAFTDAAYPDRIGWREIVLAGDGVRLDAGDVPTTSRSARLTAYPDDLLAQPPTLASVEFGAERIAGASDAAAGSRSTVGPASSAVVAQAAVPGGAEALPVELAVLVGDQTLTPSVLLVGLLVAVGLGAFHALTPGHGKTIMAAYLVGTRGDVPRALGLGATVAISHTIGVLLLALVVLAASSVLPAERLFPVLSVVSGALVAGLGAWLLLAAIRRLRAMRADRQHHEHDHGHEHAAHDHHHDAPRAPEVGADDSWHDHGGVRHRHLPTGDPDQPVRWLGILTLGLAGGMIPSTSAILLLLAAVASGRPALGVVLVVAFGVGMAGVLGAIGLALVCARGLIDRLPLATRGGRLGLATSFAAATVVLALGLLLTSQSLAAFGL